MAPEVRQDPQTGEPVDSGEEEPTWPVEGGSRYSTFTCGCHVWLRAFCCPTFLFLERSLKPGWHGKCGFLLLSLCSVLFVCLRQGLVLKTRLTSKFWSFCSSWINLPSTEIIGVPPQLVTIFLPVRNQIKLNMRRHIPIFCAGSSKANLSSEKR